jgi:hypothetical protein
MDLFIENNYVFAISSLVILLGVAFIMAHRDHKKEKGSK